MSDEEKSGLGRAIINGIIKDGLVCAPIAGLNSWAANADEVLEAIVNDFNENSSQCEICDNHALLGVHDPEGIFICCDCLPPLSEENVESEEG